MSREPKLRLVRGGVDPAIDGTEPTADALPGEAPETQRCRELVHATTARPPLDAVDHEVLLALSVGEVAAEFSPADRRRAAALGEAIDVALTRRSPQSLERATAELEPPLAELVELSLTVHAATGRATIDEVTNERLLQRALGTEGAVRPQPRRNAMLATVAAVAAAVALFWGTLSLVEETTAPVARPADEPRAPAPPVELIPSRSTQALFDPAKPFPRRGGESARVDRIAHARAAELRANRFAMWGVP